MTGQKSITDALAAYEAEHDFARRVTMPVEDRAKYLPAAKWDGGYRWFKSPNVICLEKFRWLRAKGRI
jgi:hypothetical protein